MSSTSEINFINFLPQNIFFGIGKANVSAHDNINYAATFVIYIISTDSGSVPQSATYAHDVVFFMLQIRGVVLGIF